jgi:hypothetical protein
LGVGTVVTRAPSNPSHECNMSRFWSHFSAQRETGRHVLSVVWEIQVTWFLSWDTARSKSPHWIMVLERIKHFLASQLICFLNLEIMILSYNPELRFLHCKLSNNRDLSLLICIKCGFIWRYIFITCNTSLVGRKRKRTKPACRTPIHILTHPELCLQCCCSNSAINDLLQWMF